MSRNGLPLAEAIEHLRTELSEAIDAGKGKGLRFAPESIDLELQVEVATAASTEAGAKFWVLSAAAAGSREQSSTHTLKLRLRPVDASGDDVLIADSDRREPG
jgi:hypothetical protein